MINEWTADPDQQLEIPADITQRQRYRFSVPAPISLSGTCAEWVAVQSGAILKDALVDTSERAHGLMLKKRVTHRRELAIVNAPIVVILLDTGE